MSFSFGEKVKVTLFGESHGQLVGITVEGITPGFEPDWQKLDDFMARRAPGGQLATPRREPDKVKVVSGIFEGRCSGAPICGIIENKDVRDSDYDRIKNVPRPGHSDYTAKIRYNGFNDYRGSGALGGRMTAPLCFAGGLVIQLLEKKGIIFGTEITELGGKAVSGIEEINGIIAEAKEKGDSVGGKIRCTVSGVPAGLGDPFFDGLDSTLGHIVFSVPGIKGIEFGETQAFGSKNNDTFIFEDGKIKTLTNRHGGLLGGMTSGMPIVFTCTVKPTSSIHLTQKSIDIGLGTGAEISVTGRHDPCILPRVMPCIEAAAALAIAQYCI